MLVWVISHREALKMR